MNFRVGQLVEVVDNRGMVAPLGATAVVTGIGSEYLDVKWKTRSNGQADGGYYPRSFKPVFTPVFTKGQQLLFSFMSATEGM